MSTNRHWIFVDDNAEGAQTFAQELSESGAGITVVAVMPDEHRTLIASHECEVAGLLMDVDLSNAPGVEGTGPGLAQDLRIRQQIREVADFPIVRFAGRDVVQRNIGVDPASHDLFDLEVMKEQMAHGGAAVIAKDLASLEQIYQAMRQFASIDRAGFSELVAIGAGDWERFGHPGLADRMLSALQGATHVAAGVFLRSFVLVPGLLIDETLLAVRLGVERQGGWQTLRDTFEFVYRGPGHEGFPRWWARALDDWWATEVGIETPLSATKIQLRAEALAALGFSDLVPLSMPEGSAGERPWRLCSLSLERNPPRIVPVDPLESVRMTSTIDLPSWTDPRYAALRPALQSPKDYRLNSSDLARLRARYP